MPQNTDYITAPVKQFCEEIAGIGLTKAYELINQGELQSITVGKRRLVLLKSWYDFVERSLSTPADAPAASPPRPKRRATRSGQ
ncbi:MAG TPA: hypothetical protein VFX06_06290, partial [Stellaceae bacterium]|nr:hypothetical protein [Stellaceae bacterium]